jgi:hypothetical protein
MLDVGHPWPVTFVDVSASFSLTGHQHFAQIRPVFQSEWRADR